MSDKIIGRIYLTQEELNSIFEAIRESDFENVFESLDAFPVDFKEIGHETC